MADKSVFQASIKQIFQKYGIKNVEDAALNDVAVALADKIKFCATVSYDVTVADHRKKILERDADFVLENHIGGC
jgi:hypothetical protein